MPLISGSSENKYVCLNFLVTFSQFFLAPYHYKVDILLLKSLLPADEKIVTVSNFGTNSNAFTFI